jgi:hypothetical protein
MREERRKKIIIKVILCNLKDKTSSSAFRTVNKLGTSNPTKSLSFQLMLSAFPSSFHHEGSYISFKEEEDSNENSQN